MSGEQILERIGGQGIVRDFLRGVEPGSEMDRDARRSMLAAIAGLRAADVHDVMATEEPELYAQAALFLCQLYTDASMADADKILAMYRSIMLTLRYDPRNIAAPPAQREGLRSAIASNGSR